MIRIGIICPSEIAFRRFLPALQKASDRACFTAIGMASPQEWFGDLSAVSAAQVSEQQARERSKAQMFVDQYGGEIVEGYGALVSSDKVDAVYLPLPPALHYPWAKMALEHGKHVFVEKPSTTSLADTDHLIALASERGLALHENYMFVYHDQLRALSDVVSSGELGSVRNYRITFGFPLRQQNDFRYVRSLGGGALLDAGGYCLRYADYLLGPSARLTTAQVGRVEGFEVEMFGSATLVNDQGVAAQLAFGMDNDYRCELEVWGSLGTLTSGRVLTAPAGFVPTYTIKKNQETRTFDLPADDAFLRSIHRFADCVADEAFRREEYALLHRQESLVDAFMKKIETNV